MDAIRFRICNNAEKAYSQEIIKAEKGDNHERLSKMRTRKIFLCEYVIFPESLGLLDHCDLLQRGSAKM